VKLALGLRAHSGWAALVAVAAREGAPLLVDRRRIELIDEADSFWAKQPYHAAEGLEPDEACDVVKRGIASARRLALRELRAAESCGLPLVAIREKDLEDVAERALGAASARLEKSIAELGKSAGAPWGADQKQSALAAWIGLQAPASKRR
jgi:hypothetical protein